jgi:hypothetical protein
MGRGTAVKRFCKFTIHCTGRLGFEKKLRLYLAARYYPESLSNTVTAEFISWPAWAKAGFGFFRINFHTPGGDSKSNVHATHS